MLLYLVGRFVASLGQQMLTVAVGWELYERTHSALALGLVGLTQMLPMVLFTLPAGHVADNHERKRIIVLMNLVMAVASLGLTLISALGAPVFWIYCCLFAAGTARTFLWPASAAFLPQLVSRRTFSAGGGLEQRQLPALLGGRAGGRRRADRPDPPRGPGLCGQRRRGADLPHADQLRAAQPHGGGEGEDDGRQA